MVNLGPASKRIPIPFSFGGYKCFRVTAHIKECTENQGSRTLGAALKIILENNI